MSCPEVGHHVNPCSWVHCSVDQNPQPSLWDWAWTNEGDQRQPWAGQPRPESASTCSVIGADCFPALCRGMFQFGDAEHSAPVRMVLEARGPRPAPHPPASLPTSVPCVPDTPASSCQDAYSPVSVVKPMHQDPLPQRGKGRALHDSQGSTQLHGDLTTLHTGWFTGPGYPIMGVSVKSNTGRGTKSSPRPF